MNEEAVVAVHRPQFRLRRQPLVASFFGNDPEFARTIESLCDRIENLLAQPAKTEQVEAVFLSGDRGTGKTTVLHTFLKRVRDTCSKVWAPEPFDSSRLPRSQSIPMTLIAHLGAEFERLAKDDCRCLGPRSEVQARAQATERAFRLLTQAVSSYQRNFDDAVRQSSMTLAEFATLNEEYAARVSHGRELFRNWVKCALEQSARELLVVTFDDADIAADEPFQLLAFIQAMLMGPQVLVIAAGDEDDFQRALTKAYLERMGVDRAPGEHWSKLDRKANQLANALLRKTFPPPLRLYLRNVDPHKRLGYRPLENEARTIRALLEDRAPGLVEQFATYEGVERFAHLLPDTPRELHFVHDTLCQPDVSELEIVVFLAGLEQDGLAWRRAIAAMDIAASGARNLLPRTAWHLLWEPSRDPQAIGFDSDRNWFYAPARGARWRTQLTSAKTSIEAITQCRQAGELPLLNHLAETKLERSEADEASEDSPSADLLAEYFWNCWLEKRGIGGIWTLMSHWPVLREGLDRRRVAWDFLEAPTGGGDQWGGVEFPILAYCADASPEPGPYGEYRLEWVFKELSAVEPQGNNGPSRGKPFRIKHLVRMLQYLHLMNPDPCWSEFEIAGSGPLGPIDRLLGGVAMAMNEGRPESLLGESDWPKFSKWIEWFKEKDDDTMTPLAHAFAHSFLAQSLLQKQEEGPSPPTQSTEDRSAK